MSEHKNGMSVKVIVFPVKDDGPINLDRPRKVPPQIKKDPYYEEIKNVVDRMKPGEKR